MTRIRRIHEILLHNKKTISVAESCTAGLVSSLLTQFPGSSAYFKAGIIPYETKTKIDLLNILPQRIKRYGVVSREIAKDLAENIRIQTHSDIGVGITGFAGPDGGNQKNPIGTVYIGIASCKKTTVCRSIFQGTRKTIQTNAAKKTMFLLDKLLAPSYQL